MNIKRKILSYLNSVHFYFFIPGIGCGVLGLALKRSSKSIGEYAETLLKALEYRGYDSTGAAFLDEGKKITLLKDVGAPSVLSKTLGINKEKGKIFCGQVRWATFGRVDKTNAQPHIVSCKRHIFGAHNGNITNSAEMKSYFNEHKHSVVSDNDGEIVVHAVEDSFDFFLSKHPEAVQLEPEVRTKCMREAIPHAIKKLEGSFAAVIVDPITEVSYAIKAGSSLYFGMGEMETEGSFALASSDLTAVLKFTKNLIDLKEGQFVEYTASEYKVFAFKDLKIEARGQETKTFKMGDLIDSPLKASKLRAEDTGLNPKYKYFMEQEIYSEIDSSQSLSVLFDGGSVTSQDIFYQAEKIGCLKFFQDIILTCNLLTKEKFETTYNSNEFKNFLPVVQKIVKKDLLDLSKEDLLNNYFFSAEKNSLIDLVESGADKSKLLLAKVFDSLYEINDAKNFENAVDEFSFEINKSYQKGRNVYLIACGTSFHAAKTSALYFSEIAGIPVIPILPGEFRGQYENCLRDGDLLIGVSQSGETKDLIDVVDYITKKKLKITKIMLVNNMNSTLGQEKCDIVVPINCGPEIAVPATKSFMNQLVLFYYLAIKSFEKLVQDEKSSDEEAIKKLLFYRYSYRDIPELIKSTLQKIEKEETIDRVAKLNFLAPSMQILATRMTGIAKEGALKIRETVLNHTEGSEASEFKHGPNTILGKNTLYGIDTILNMGNGLNVSDNIFENLKDVISKEEHNYPLVYITGPDEKDINLTISQINTHKIRGANTFVIAEENKKLRENIKFEDPKSMYQCEYIVLPTTKSVSMTTISASVALQILSLKMSIQKMNFLNDLQMKGHGVHPDVPKNVSKSITVD